MVSQYVNCPMCGRPFAALPHHLKRSHRVANPEERQLLLKLANKRVFYRYEHCPVSGCRYQSSRCDKHLETCHPELTKEQLDRAVVCVQKRVTVRQLADLRATAPHPPMVSHLDQEEDEELDAWSDEDAEPQASCRGCNTLVRKYEGVKRQLDNLRKIFRIYHRRVSRFERRTGKKITKNLPVPEEEVCPSTSRGPQQRPGGRPHAAGRRPPYMRAGEPRSGRTRQREVRRSVAKPSSPASSAPSSASPPPSRPSPRPSRQSTLTSRKSRPRPSSKRAGETRSGWIREAKVKHFGPSPLSSPASSSSSASSSPSPPPSRRSTPSSRRSPPSSRRSPPPSRRSPPSSRRSTPSSRRSPPSSHRSPPSSRRSPPSSRRSPPPSRRSPPSSRRSPSPCDPSPSPPTACLRLSPTPSPPSSPPPPPSPRPSKVKTPPVAASQSSVAPSSGRREEADSPPPKKRARKTRHTGGSPPPEESPESSPEESRSPRKKTSRRNPASLLSGFSPRMEKFLDDYRAFLRGTHKSNKQLDNAASKVMRVRRFLNFMAVGGDRLWDWSFLTQTGRVVEWVSHLKRCGKKVTTITFYLRNVYSFLRYFKETPPPHCRLKGAQVTAVLRAVLQCISPLLRDVSIHQMKVKEAKQMRVVSVADLKLCRQRCRVTIPELLELLEAKPTNVKLRYRFFGYMAAFISSIYGHRTGVITNMTVTEVMNARKNAKEGSPGFVVNIAEHKTNRFFGYAQVFLHPEEFSWMERWLAVRRQLKAHGDLFFFGATAQPNKNLVRYMQAAWEEMGLSGKPTFTDLRTAVASHAKERHIPQVREMISAAMCHDVRTADKFYTVVLDPVKCAALRGMFEQATDTQEDPAPSNVSLESRTDPGTEDTSGLTDLPPARKALRRRRRRRDTSGSSTQESEGHVSYRESGSSDSTEDEVEHHPSGQSTPVRGSQPDPTAPQLPVEHPPFATSTPVRGSQPDTTTPQLPVETPPFATSTPDRGSQPDPTTPQLPVNPSEAGQPQEPEQYTGPSTTRRSNKPVLRQFPKVVLSPLKMTAKKKKEHARKFLRFRTKKCL